MRGHHYDSRIYTHFQFTEEDKYQEDSNTSHQYTSPWGCVTCTSAENTDSPQTVQRNLLTWHKSSTTGQLYDPSKATVRGISW